MVDNSDTSFDDLPVEATTQIFTRLPVKTLIRSTSVSKTWYSLITNPGFISAHIRHSLSCCDQTAVFIIPMWDDNSCSLISTHTGHVLKNYNIPFTTNSGRINLVGSLNGVLCLSDFPDVDEYEKPNVDEFREMYLWNPSVDKYKALFSSCFKKRSKCSYSVGLGFLEDTCDLRVVRVMYCKDDVGCLFGKVAPKVEVYSLRTNTWRRIRNPGVPRVALRYGINVGNSVTYWLDNNTSRSYFAEEYVVYFDFNREVFGQIILPDDVRTCLGSMADYTLMNFEGKLALCVYNETTEIHGMKVMPCCVWVLSHEDGKVSWTPRFTVLVMEHAWPICLSRSGALVMLSSSGPDRGLVSCNLKSQDQDFTEPFVTLPSSVDASFVESLLMLEGQDELLKSAPLK